MLQSATPITSSPPPLHRIADRTSSQDLGVTWRHRYTHVTIWYPIPGMSFPIGGHLERSLYLRPFSRYCALSVLGGITSLTFQGHVTSSVTWPFDSPCAISYCGPLEPSLYPYGYRTVESIGLYGRLNWDLWQTLYRHFITNNVCSLISVF